MQGGPTFRGVTKKFPPARFSLLLFFPCLRFPLLPCCFGHYFLNSYSADFVFGYFADRVESRVGKDIRIGFHEVEAHEDRSWLHEICQQHLAHDFTPSRNDLCRLMITQAQVCRVKRIDLHVPFRHLPVKSRGVARHCSRVVMREISACSQLNGKLVIYKLFRGSVLYRVE